jgi:chromate reductase
MPPRAARSTSSICINPPEIFAPTSYAEKPASFAPFQEALSKAAGIVVVTPEYNGGFPGVFKYFIDMLKFPETFNGKPFAFVGLSAGIGGAVRPVEQFSTLVTYLRGVIYPGTVNIPAINNHLNESGLLKTPELIERLEKQADGFIKFVEKVGQ